MRGRRDTVAWIWGEFTKKDKVRDISWFCGNIIALIRPKNYSPHIAPWYKFMNYPALNRLSTLIKEDVYKGWIG